MGFELADERGNLSVGEQRALAAMQAEQVHAIAAFEAARRTLETEHAKEWRAWLVQRCERLSGSAGDAVACLRDVLANDPPRHGLAWAIAISDAAEEAQLRAALLDRNAVAYAYDYARWLEIRGRHEDAIVVLEPAVRASVDATRTSTSAPSMPPPGTTAIGSDSAISVPTLVTPAELASSWRRLHAAVHREPPPHTPDGPTYVADWAAVIRRLATD